MYKYRGKHRPFHTTIKWIILQTRRAINDLSMRGRTYAELEKLRERNDRSRTVRVNWNDRSRKSIVINEISFAMKKTSLTLMSMSPPLLPFGLVHKKDGDYGGGVTKI